MTGIGQFQVVGEHEQNTINQFHVATGVGPVAGAALMPDGHLGYGVPIGGVFAYKDAISPNGVGFDIGCGVKAVRTNLKIDDIDVGFDTLADEIYSQVAFGLARTSDLGMDHPVLDDPRWEDIHPALKKLKRMAADQLGTVGSGNHYVDVLIDETDDSVWIATHFGSRGFGHKTAKFYFDQIGGKDDMTSPPSIIEKERAPVLFDDYIQAMELAGDYAYAGRDVVIEQVLQILGASKTQTVHNHHNFAWKELHDNELYWVVRKGATPAHISVKGFIGSSMTGPSYIVAGTSEAEKYLWSTVHGAGRVMSRNDAKGRIKKIDGKKERQPGRVTKEMFDNDIMESGVELRGGGYDEASFVYRDLDSVIESLGDSVLVKHKLNPVIVCMAGNDIKDPYKD